MHLVMFDIDGTLTLTNEASDRSFLDALSEVTGIHQVDTNWNSYVNVTDQGCLEEIFIAALGRLPTDSETDAVRRRFAQLLRQRAAADPQLIREVDGASETFSALRQRRDVLIALATGTWLECAEIKLYYGGIDHDDIALATASDSAVRVDIMACAESRARSLSGVDSFTTRTYVGDAPWDVLASRQLSYGFIGVASDGSEARHRLREMGANLVVDDFEGERFEEFLTSLW